MARKSIFIAILLAAGCGTKNYNVASPVLGPAPPRIKEAADRQRQVNTALEKSEGLKTVSAEGVQTVSYEQAVPLEMTDLVARVNGKPIFVGDLLEQYSAKLLEYRHKMEQAVTQGALTQAQLNTKLRETQEMLIKRDLDHYVEQVLMADAVRAKLKKDQLDDVNHQLDTFFEKDYIGSLKKKFEVETTAELEGILQSQGMSLESMRKLFIDQQMASQYVRTKMGEDPRPSRAELLALYHSQREKYARPTQVQWQQLQINFAGPDKSSAARKMDEVQAALKSGTKLDELVKKYSDGPLKENGGHWPWTQPESVASPEIRSALQKLKQGETSPVITAGNSLQIVRVTARRDASHQPLEEVQEDLRQQIIGEFREQRAAQVVKDIREKAVIETIFDEDFRPADSSETR